MQKSNKSINIYILHKGPFPIGLAQTNRILSYANGFIVNKAKVRVLCLKPTENYKNVINYDASGIFKNIPYIYSSKTTIKSKSFIGRRLQNIFGILSAFSIIYNDHKKNKIDAIIFASTSLWTEFYFFILTRLLKIIYLREESEFPYIYFRNSFMGKFRLKIYERFNYKFYDGLLVISQILINYLKPKIRKRGAILHVPMTVDFERFQNLTSNSKINKTNITYIGTLNFIKDGVDILIKAFAKIITDYKDIKLCLIGDPESEDIKKTIQNIINDFNLNDKVILKGRVNSDLIPQLLFDSKILVIARPSSLQAEGGFPCKLGEYLATSNPVIVTDVGEISEYLVDGVSAFIAEPDSVNSFAEKLIYVLEHPELAKKVGLQGKNVAYEKFNSNKQATNIINFISSLKK